MKMTAFLVSVLWLTTAHADQPSITVEISNTTDLYHIKHCFTRAPDRLQAHSSLRDHIRELNWTQAKGTWKLILSDRSLRLPAGQPGCVSYQVDHRPRMLQGWPNH